MECFICIRTHFISPASVRWKAQPLQLIDKEYRALRMQQLVHRGASFPAENSPLPPRPGVGKEAGLPGTVPRSGGQGPCIPAEPVCLLKARKDPASPLMVTPKAQAQRGILIFPKDTITGVLFCMGHRLPRPPSPTSLQGHCTCAVSGH